MAWYMNPMVWVTAFKILEKLGLIKMNVGPELIQDIVKIIVEAQGDAEKE